MKEIKYCKTCAYHIPNPPSCAIFNRPVDPDKSYCDKHNTNPVVCEICRKFIVDYVIFLPTGQPVCANCLTALGTCAGCVNGSTCSFETDPSPLPKVIVQDIRQGNMIMKTQIRNPSRIEITCKKNCPCFVNNECMKQKNLCENHKCIIQQEETND